MHKIRFPMGLRPRPRWGSLQRSPDPLAVFTGPSSKERAGENWARKEEGEEGKMMGHPLPKYFNLKPPVGDALFDMSELCRLAGWSLGGRSAASVAVPVLRHLQDDQPQAP